ncbi:MAG: type 1 glutamine amidotransferase domain-containing protein [Chloroflexi bacterium]|nr:type 1 glutamine amidotransferase domain-containing protein [Chloroflexota bacterium]
MQTLLHNRTFWFIATPVIILGLLVANLPGILNSLGLHRPYPGRSFNLTGKRALIIATNHDTLGETGKATGVYASEMTVPYYQFQDANMQVDVASIEGSEIPVEPMSLRWPLLTPEDKRFQTDGEFQDKVKNSLKIEDLDFTQYDIVYMAGGWGAAYDLGYSDLLGQKISEAYAADVVLGSICHGVLGFLRATDENGNPLVQGRRMTGVTDKQVQELGITITPLHPERELRAAGALYESETAFRDFFASHVVVDGTLVTGQNQNDGAEVAQLMMEMIEKRN